MSLPGNQKVDTKRISVIVPVYNGERYLEEALESVLAQTLKPFEVIVVNDGSTDRSSDVLDRFGESLIRVDQKNSGTAAARNRGVLESSGDCFAFLDQDDYWHEEKLEKQVRLLVKSPDTQLVWGSVQQFFSPELPEQFKKRFRCQKDPMPGYLPSALFIRREAFEKVGAFNTKWKLGEWADWYARCTQINLVSDRVSDVVAYRRIHEGNKGITMAGDRSEYISLIRENLKRKESQ